MIFSLFTTLLAASAPPAHADLLISPCEAGEHRQFEIVDCNIELRNTGDQTITVSNGEAKLPWDRIDTSKISIAPKSTAYIKATVDLRNDEGEVRRAFRFETDEPGQARRGSEVRAFVLPLLDQSKPTLDFGTVRLGDEPLPTRTIQLTSREVVDFQIKSIDSAPVWLDAAIGEDRRTIRATLKDSVPWGHTHHGQAFVKVTSNAKPQSTVWVEVDVNALGDVVPDANPYQFGVIRSEGKHEFLLRISSRSDRAFDLGNVEVVGIKAETSVDSCTPASAGCKLIRIDVANDQPTGKLEGVLRIELSKIGKVLPVELVGMLLTPGTKIHKLDEIVDESTEKAGSMSASAGSVDIGRVIKEAVKEEAPPPLGNGPLLRWSVAHQSAIYGYAIYRSDREQGPYVRINDEIIQASKEGKDKAGRYQWRDVSAISGKTYWYRIGIVNRNGSKQDLTSSQKVTAK